MKVWVARTGQVWASSGVSGETTTLAITMIWLDPDRKQVLERQFLLLEGLNVAWKGQRHTSTTLTVRYRLGVDGDEFYSLISKRGVVRNDCILANIVSFPADG
jgi:hypothetical protein